MEEEESRRKGRAGERRGEVKRKEVRITRGRAFGGREYLVFHLFIYFEIYFTAHDIKNNQCHWSCVCRAFT